MAVSGCKRGEGEEELAQALVPMEDETSWVDKLAQSIVKVKHRAHALVKHRCIVDHNVAAGAAADRAKGGHQHATRQRELPTHDHIGGEALDERALR